MNKKNILLPVMLLFALALSGCGNKNEKQSEQKDNGQVQAQKGEKESKQAGERLKDILGMSEGVKCEVEDTMGKYTVLAKGTKVRVDGLDNGVDSEGQPKKGTLVNDGEWLYLWSEKEGLKISIKDDEEFQKDMKEMDTTNMDWREWASQMDEAGAKHDCQKATVNDSEFVPDGGIDFLDMSEWEKQYKQDNQEIPQPEIVQ